MTRAMLQPTPSELPQADAGGEEEAEQEGGTPDAASLEAEARKWKELARKNEERAKINAEKAKRLDELEAASKSEVEKAREAAAAAEKKAAEAEARALRAEIAAEKGLTARQAARLIGSTREELEADADELLADFTPAGTDGKGGTPTPPRKPTEKLRGGGDPTEEPVEMDPAKLAAPLSRL